MKIGERQFSRNELICTCLSRCPLTERFTDLNRSRIMDRRGEIALELSRSSPTALQTLTDDSILDKIKELIRKNPKITQAQMAKACGVSRTSIAGWIRRSNGSVRHVGFDNGGFWQLSD